MVKAVYCRDFSDIFTCQNPDFKSIIEKNRAPTKDSMVSCIWGRGYESFLVLAFNHARNQYRTVNPHPSSGRGPRCYTKQTVKAKWLNHPAFLGDVLGPHLKSGRAIRWNLSLKGSSSSNSIMCSAASVHPISVLFKEKM